MIIKVKQIAVESELAIAFEIRKKVFVVEQKVPLEEEYDEFEANSSHFLAFYNETPSGTARMRSTLKGIKLERFAVLKEYRGKGLGRDLINNLLTRCKNERESKVYLYAQVNAQSFYEKFGFIKKGEVFVEAGIQHIEMQYKEKREAI